MQNRLVGDIGDFSKFGLLRAIFGKPGDASYGLTLGVNWYFNEPTEAESKKSDGGRIGYLDSRQSNEEYRTCDLTLYRTFQRLVGLSLLQNQRRTISDIRSFGILNRDTIYFYDLIEKGGKTARDAWLERASRALQEAHVIFVDPDNGIYLKEETTNSRKHVSLEDLNQFYNCERKSLIIYQDLTQGNKKGETVDARIERIAGRLKEKLETICAPRVARWHRTPQRAFFIVPRTQHHKIVIDNRLLLFRRSLWKTKGHFSVVCPPS